MEDFGMGAICVASVFCLICTVLWFTCYTLPPHMWHCTQYDSVADHCVVYTHKSLWKEKP